MIILLIKTDQPLAELYLYNDQQLLASLKWSADRTLAETIHLKLVELLDKRSMKINQLDAVAIYSGPGSFTGLRIGHSVANALAYGLGLPIIGVGGSDWIKQSIGLLVEGSKDNVIAVPQYGAPARITKPRK